MRRSGFRQFSSLGHKVFVTPRLRPIRMKSAVVVPSLSFQLTQMLSTCTPALNAGANVQGNAVPGNNASPSILELISLEELEAVLTRIGNSTILVDFYARWTIFS